MPPKKCYALIMHLSGAHHYQTLYLAKLADRSGNSEEVINKFRPPIFWKDKEIVKKQINNWTISKIYNLLDDANNLEINFKKNYEFSNNLIFDIFLNTSNS